MDNPETHATFRITGDALRPDRVTELLGISPSFARAKGDVYGPPARPIRSRTGIWALESEAAINSTELEDHLAYLIAKLAPAASEPLTRLIAEGSKVDVLCFWMSATGQGGPVLSPRILARVAELGAELSFDFYSAV